MSDLVTQLPSALLAALAANTGVRALLGNPARVYDHRPAMAAFPYVVLAMSESRDIGTKTLQVSSQLVTLQVYTRQRSGSEARQVLAALKEALHDASVALGAGHVVRCQEEGSSVRYDSKSESSTALARYRVVVSA